MKYVIPILSLIISVIALAVALPRHNDLGFDYLGFIVAIISLATAFTVGFQIWNALSLENRLKELKNQIEVEYSQKITLLEEKLIADIDNKSKLLSIMNAYQTSITSASISYSNGLNNETFYSYIQALEFETILLREYHADLSDSVAHLIKSLIDESNIKIIEPEKQKYIIKTIIDSGKEELIEKIGIIKSKIFSSEN